LKYRFHELPGRIIGLRTLGQPENSSAPNRGRSTKTVILCKLIMQLIVQKSHRAC